MTSRPRIAFAGLAGLGIWLTTCGSVTAQEAPKAAVKAVPPKPAAAGIGREGLIRLASGANPMVWLLGICSIVTVSYSLERLFGLRKSRVAPKEFINRFHERLEGGKLDRERALELCRANDSNVARVFASVVRYWGQPAATIRQAVEADAAGEVVDMKRNVRVLSATSTIAPLIGLLGTVWGMIESFDAIGSKGGGASKGEALAQGIGLALFSTAIGLAIAITSVTMYYILLGRVDGLVRELDDQARRAIDLVSAEATRPAADARRGPYAADRDRDHARHEPRIH